MPVTMLLSCLCRKEPGHLWQVTYKVSFGAQPLPLVLVEKALQEVTGSHRPAHRDLQWLVQNVLIHLGYVSAVEGWLVREKERELQDHPCSSGHRSQRDLEQSWVTTSCTMAHRADWRRTV